MRNGILSTIGQSPLVRLTSLFPDAQFSLYAKLESSNPGGSIKDRAAYTIIAKAIEEGRLTPGATVIESSSGNMGIGLAQVCTYLGFRFICVVDPKTTKANINLLKAYGAEVDMVTEPDPLTGEFLQARVDRVQMLLRKMPHSYWPNQYANVNNAVAHHQTMHEIVTALDGRVDYLFCAASTCGTVRGCAEYIRANRLETKLIGVDAIGSVIFGGPARKRLIPGHGAARRSELFQPGLVERCFHVSDLECVVNCRRLVRREAIVAGGSAGGVLAAVERAQHLIPKNSKCVAILADRGERYLDTIYSDSWVREHFGEVSHLWEAAAVAA